MPAMGFRTFADESDDAASRPPSDVPPSRLSQSSLLIVIAFAALLMLPALDGSYRVLTLHEVFAAQTAREMVATGDWIIPRFAGEPRLNKPAGMYWLIGAFMSIFQSREEWVVRLPSAIAGILTAVMIARLAARWLGNFAGLVAGLMQASFFYVGMQARLAEADMALCAAVVLAMTAFATAVVNRRGSVSEPSRRRRLLLAFAFGVGVGLAVLLKGVGIAFIFAGCLLWMLVARRWDGLRFVFHPLSLLPMLAIPLAWALPAMIREPRLLEIWRFESVDRAGGAFDDADPWHIYLWAVPMLLLPWTVFAVRGFIHWRRTDEQAAAEDARLGTSSAESSPRNLIQRWRIPHRVAFLLAWFVGGMILLQISQARHKHYAIPMLPPITILAALGFVNWLHDPKRLSGRAATIVAIAIAVAGGIAAVIVTMTMSKAAAPTAIIAVLIALGIAVATLFHARRQLRRTTIACFASAAVGAIGASMFVIPAFDDYKALTALARSADRQTPPGQTIYLVALGQTQAAYYIDHPMKRIDKRDPARIAAGLDAGGGSTERYVLCPRSAVYLLSVWGQPQIVDVVDHRRRSEKDETVFVRVIKHE